MFPMYIVVPNNTKSYIKTVFSWNCLFINMSLISFN